MRGYAVLVVSSLFTSKVQPTLTPSSPPQGSGFIWSVPIFVSACSIPETLLARICLWRGQKDWFTVEPSQPPFPGPYLSLPSNFRFFSLCTYPFSMYL